MELNNGVTRFEALPAHTIKFPKCSYMNLS